MSTRPQLGFEAYQVEEDSDQEGGESSDDGLDLALHGALARKRGPRLHGNESASSEDEFEKEMAAELNHTMEHIETGQTYVRRVGSGPEGQETSAPKQEGQRFYDESYFDSDSDEEGSREQKKKKSHPMPTDDELLYDPCMDDKDQLWVDKQRRGYLPQTHAGAAAAAEGARPRPLPHSDAVLNCPACMSLLTLDCQRHETLHHQYRAMFVSNCAIDRTETLRYPALPLANQRRDRRREVKVAKRHFSTLKADASASTLDASTSANEVAANADERETNSETLAGDVSSIGKRTLDEIAAAAAENATGDNFLEVKPITDSREEDMTVCNEKIGAGGVAVREKTGSKLVGWNQQNFTANGCDRGVTRAGAKDGKAAKYEAEKTRGGMERNGGEVADEIYYPVRCEVCNTEVGVFDRDEVYHFFNVLSSYA